MRNTLPTLEMDSGRITGAKTGVVGRRASEPPKEKEYTEVLVKKMNGWNREGKRSKKQ